MLNVLTVTEHDELQRHEQTIERGLTTFVDVGTALLAIRDGRLYRLVCTTFEEYCRKRWGFSRIHAHRLIEAAEVSGNLLPIGNKMPTTESQARPLAQLEPDQQREAWALAVETAPNGKVTAAHIERVVDQMTGEIVDAAPPDEPPPPDRMAVHFSSESPEWYTPPSIITRAVELLGAIDLDPCSNSKHNPRIPAGTHYTKADNGLGQPWTGRVYMNPPYGREIADWVEYLCEQYEAGEIIAAVALVPSRTDTEWFYRLRDYPRCFIKGRLSFSDNENPAPFPSMVVYLGRDVEGFVQIFGDMGDAYSRTC